MWNGQIGESSFLLDRAIELISALGGDETWFSINDSLDDSRVKTISGNGQVLSTGIVTNVLGNAIDDRKRFSLVALRLVERAKGGF